MLVQQNACIPFDGPERGPQIVRNGIGEGFEILVQDLELGGPVPYPLFQARSD
jgi:hypothetical protein